MVGLPRSSVQSSVMVEMESPRITKLSCKAYVDRAVPAFLTAGRLHRERKSGCSLSPLSPALDYPISEKGTNNEVINIHRYFYLSLKLLFVLTK